MMIRRRARRRQEKAIANQRFLSRKVSKRGNRILQKFPDIGETIENFVETHRVGADAWRRTGVLTFDGNTKLENKSHTKKFVSIFRTLTSTNFPMELSFNFASLETRGEDQQRGRHQLQKSQVAMPEKAFT